MNAIDSTWVNNTELQLNHLEKSIDSLQNRLDLMQTKTDMLMDIIGTSNESVSNQLSAAGWILAIIAVILTLASIFLGLYIRKKRAEIVAIGKTIAEKKEAMQKMEISITELDEKIHGNLGDLYRALRKEETEALLDRLVIEPQDVSNLLPLLLARNLDTNSFEKLKKAYLKIQSVDEEESDINCYMLLFFQHFCYQAIQDNDICPQLVKNFSDVCEAAFKQDIIKSTKDLCKALSDDYSTFKKEDVLMEYLKALNGSKYNRLEELKNIMEQNIHPKELLENAIDRCRRVGVQLVIFDAYPPKGKNNTAS